MRVPFDKRSEKDKLQLLSYLKYRVAYFSRVAPIVLPHITPKLTLQEYSSGDTIIRKGDKADCMYIILIGQIGIDIGGRIVGTKKPTDVLGEAGLEDREEGDYGYRTATCVAMGEVALLRLSKIDYDNIIFDIKRIQRAENLTFLQKINVF